MTKPFRVEMKVRNNRILKAIESMGFRSPKAFCDAFEEARYETVSAFVAFRRSPIVSWNETITQCLAPQCSDKTMGPKKATCKKHSELPIDESVLPVRWSKSAEKLAELLGEDPEYLWPEFTRQVRNARKVILEVSEEQVRQLSTATDSLEEAETAHQIQGVMKSLPERSRKVIEDRFGFNPNLEEKTLEEIAKRESVNRERIRQIEAKALRRLRHPSRSKVLSGDAPMPLPYEEQQRINKERKEAETYRRRREEQQKIWEEFRQEAARALRILKRARKKEYTSKQLSRLLQMSQARIARILRHVGIGRSSIGHRLYTRKEIIRWLEEGGVFSTRKKPAWLLKQEQEQ